MVNAIGSVQQFRKYPITGYGSIGINQAQNGLNFGAQPQFGQNPLEAGQNQELTGGIFAAAIEKKTPNNAGNDAAGILAYQAPVSNVTNPNIEGETETNDAVDCVNKTVAAKNEEIKDNVEEQKKKIAAVGSQLNITA